MDYHTTLRRLRSGFDPRRALYTNHMATNRQGSITETQLVACFTKAGYQVLLPVGVARYDLVVEKDGEYLRVQAKTGRLRNGAILANGYSNPGGRELRKYTKEEVDAIGIYCADTNECYLVPIDQMMSKVSLRVEPSGNNQDAGIRWASDYKLS